MDIVIINQHRNIAIVATTSGKNLLVIKSGRGKLTVIPLSLEKIRVQGYTASDYPPKLAAQSYLQHDAGVSDRARKYLEKIACGEFSDSLIFIRGGSCWAYSVATIDEAEQGASRL